MIRLTLILPICLMWPIGAFGQTCGLFVEAFQKYRDADRPVLGAKVRILGKEISAIAQPVKASSFEGFYLVTKIPSGTYQVTVSGTGFMRSRQTLEVECVEGALQTRIEMVKGSSARTKASRSRAADAVFNASN